MGNRHKEVFVVHGHFPLEITNSAVQATLDDLASTKGSNKDTCRTVCLSKESFVGHSDSILTLKDELVPLEPIGGHTQKLPKRYQIY